jgi:hypothetical protein
MTGTPQQQLRDLYLKMQGAKLQKKKEERKIAQLTLKPSSV